MKINSYLILFVVTLFCSYSTLGQDVIKNKPCTDCDAIKKQADSIKQSMSKDGFVVVKEASMTMESEYELPVIVPLNESAWYHIVFIGDASSRLIELRMYDWEEKEIVYKKSKNDNITDGNGANNNILDYRYVPKFSEYHMIKPVQVNKKKKKEISGYIMLLKKVK